MNMHLSINLEGNKNYNLWKILYSFKFCFYNLIIILSKFFSRLLIKIINIYKIDIITKNLFKNNIKY